MSEEIHMSTPPTEKESRTLVKRVLAASTIGTVMEWYDFYLYGFASAIIFNRIFFPEFDPLAGTLAAFASYALGFFARPLGGLFFGSMGDRIGRKSMLVITMTIMGTATALMGALPTYDQIGLWAAVLLTFLRVLQGFAAGAEWGGAVVLAAEYAPKNKRGFYTSLPNAGIYIAIIMSIGVLQLLSVTLSDEAFMAWGWRLPFLASVILIGVGLYMRLKIAESPDFQELQRNKLLVRKPIRQVFKNSPGTMLLAMGTRFAETGGGYIIITFVLTYLANHAGVGKGLGQYGLMIAAAVALVATPLLAKLSDRIGRKPVYAFGAVGLGLFIYPYFMMLNTGIFPVVALAMVLSIGVFYSAMAATQPAMYSELFDPSVRVSGVVAIREVSAPIAGGIAPFIATALLINSNGQFWPIALYVVGMCALSAISLFFLRTGSMETGQPARTDQDKAPALITNH